MTNSQLITAKCNELHSLDIDNIIVSELCFKFTTRHHNSIK